MFSLLYTIYNINIIVHSFYLHLQHFYNISTIWINNSKSKKWCLWRTIKCIRFIFWNSKWFCERCMWVHHAPNYITIIILLSYKSIDTSNFPYIIHIIWYCAYFSVYNINNTWSRIRIKFLYNYWWTVCFCRSRISIAHLS